MFWKIKSICIICLCVSIISFAQTSEPDSLKNVVEKATDDSLKVDAMISLAAMYYLSDPAKATDYGLQAKELSQTIGYKKGLALSYKWLGITYYYNRKYYEAFVYSNKSLNVFEEMGDDNGVSNILNNIGAFYREQGDKSKALEYYLKALRIAEQNGNKLRMETTLANIGVMYSESPATLDKALQYYKQALPIAIELKNAQSLGIIYANMGEVLMTKEQLPEAYKNFRLAIQNFGESPEVSYVYNDLGKLYKKQKKYDSSLYYFRKGYAIAKEAESTSDMAQSYIGIAHVQEELNQPREAIAFYRKVIDIEGNEEFSRELKEAFAGLSTTYTGLKDYQNAHLYEAKLNQLYRKEDERKLNFISATLDYSMELQKQANQIDKLIKENEIRKLELDKETLAKNASIAILITVLIISVIMLFIIRQRKRLNTILYKQKEEIEQQKQSVEKALADLKAAQSQLIHAEKMASLGELTAGIAHEIQNPLNFVNNFSEVSKELILELQEELEAGNKEDVKEIAESIIQNLQKINHHGKRADAIVKGMLQHSRSTTGTKEPVNINALAEEYLRISFLGLRAKDSSFNINMKTEFDKSIGRVNIIPSDIGRVIVNLTSNAFYAAGLPYQNGSDTTHEEPTVWIITKKQNDHVLISVRDNGPGIPKKVLDKIFQPFFTTKPTGQGTGLGLSLSYDIVKAHGGELKVDTEEGNGATFTIVLPIS